MRTNETYASYNRMCFFKEAEGLKESVGDGGSGKGLLSHSPVPRNDGTPSEKCTVRRPHHCVSIRVHSAALDGIACYWNCTCCAFT